jgi:AraC-like DNA-binding protein
MIFIAGGTLAFFFEFLLLGKKSKTLPDKILAIWMFIIGLHLFLYYFYTKGIDFKYPHLLGIANPFPLIHGPLLFLYTGSLTGYFPKWKAKYLLHFLPVLSFYCYYYDFFISTGQEKIEFVRNLSVKPDTFHKFIFPAILLSGFSYIFLTFLLFRKHRRNILNNLSNSDDRNNLHWLRNLIIGLLVIWLVVLLGDFVLDSSLQNKAIYVTVTLFVAVIGFFGLRQGNIFMNLPNGSLPAELTVEEQQRYSKSGLKEERAIEIQQLLLKLMEEKKLYLDENISLPQLAETLNIHPNYLSQVINERFQKNFYDFINSYRIEEFKRLIASGKNKNKTFFALALDCGFNSKASFNNSFKKITGITPSEFVKSL